MPAPISNARLWTGRVVSALVGLFLLFDAVIHLLQIAPVLEAFNQLGYSPDLAPTLGVIELICLALYLIPRTSILGAILLTGYLGGAVASNLRIGNPLFSHVLFPVYLGILLWTGLYFRLGPLRTLIPLRKLEAR